MSRTTSRTLATASDNATLVRAGDVRFVGYNIINTSASPRHVKLYDKATSPNSTDTPFLTFTVPGNSELSSVEVAGSAGLRLNRGLGFRITANLPDNDNTAIGAGEVLCQLVWEVA
jgi:hypothetical protein